MDQCRTPEGYKLCPELKQVDSVKKPNMKDLKDTVSKIGTCMDRIYKIRPDWKPKEDK